MSKFGGLMARLLNAIALSFCVFLIPLASATTIYTLNADGCSGKCGTIPFGQVMLTQLNSQTVSVEVELFNGDQFVKTGAGDAVEFNINGNPAITITGLTSGFSVGPAPDTASTFGGFDYSITCGGCGPGASDPLPGPLQFHVQLAGGGDLSVDDFIANSKGFFFSADIIGDNGKTGNVAADGPTPGPTPVPEPSAAILALLGFSVLGLSRMAIKRS